MAKKVRLDWDYPEERITALAGWPLDERHYGRVFGGEDVDVYKREGGLLFKLRVGAIHRSLCAAAFPALKRAARPNENRGLAAGIITQEELARLNKRAAVIRGARYHPWLANGTISATSYAKVVHSGAIGYMDRGPRRDFCRLTAHTAEDFRNDLAGWQAFYHFTRTASEVFRAEGGEHFKAQMAAVARTPADYIIKDTAFTTVTSNWNFRTWGHWDEGDLREGLGVMAVVEGEERYGGGFLVFPRHGVAVDVRTSDVLLCDVHELHGNSPFLGDPERFDRISTVFYFRAGMVNCLPSAQELERAESRRSR